MINIMNYESMLRFKFFQVYELLYDFCYIVCIVFIHFSVIIVSRIFIVINIQPKTSLKTTL